MVSYSRKLQVQIQSQITQPLSVTADQDDTETSVVSCPVKQWPLQRSVASYRYRS